MSIEIMTRVWKGAPYSGGTLLVLLALADYADDYGICWPSQTDIAGKARLTERQLRTTLHTLEREGELLVRPGRGRGNRTIYCILSGLPDADREEKRKRFPVIISGIDFRLSPEKRKLAAQKAEVSDIKKRKFTVSSDAGLARPDTADPTPIRHVIRHVDPPPPCDDEKLREKPAGGGGGGGGGGESIEAPTETETYLLIEGFSDAAAHEFRALDLVACQRDIRKAKDGGQQNGGIIRRWRRAPPRPAPLVTEAYRPPAVLPANAPTKAEARAVWQRVKEQREGREP